MSFPILVVGGRRLIDVPFHCMLCGPRYWQVEEPEHAYTDEWALREAIRQEAAWHGENVRLSGSPWPPVGIEPLWSENMLRMAPSRLPEGWRSEPLPWPLDLP